MSGKSLYKPYLLALLTTILAFNYVDRLALGLLLQDVKADLALSDTELGLLSGIAFALFYSVMGIPIARWADRGNRVTIIALTTAIWSTMVALCGLAGSFLQLMLIRAGVAIGEAGCVPPAHSLIADQFTRAERPRAVACYMMGSSFSVVIGYFLAGWLNELYGWRVTFMLLGLPGLGLATLAWLTLREPRVRASAQSGAHSESKGSVELGTESGSSPAELPSLGKVWATLWPNATFRHLLLAFSVMIFLSFGIWHWAPTFFVRSFGLQTGEVGTWFAVIWGVGGVVGTYSGGIWASRYAAGNERLQLSIMALVYVGFAAVAAGIYLASSQSVALALMGVAALGSSSIGGPLFATIQSLVPPRMRALSIAVIYLFANLIGMGIGPLAAGALSDALRPYFGEESLRYALLALSPTYLWAAWHLWRGSLTVTRDIGLQVCREPLPAGAFDSTYPDVSKAI